MFLWGEFWVWWAGAMERWHRIGYGKKKEENEKKRERQKKREERKMISK